MMRPFGRDNGVEIVLGYSYIDPDEDDAFGRRRRAFDYVADSVRWIGTAIARAIPSAEPSTILAYTKDVFTAQQGLRAFAQPPPLRRRRYLHKRDSPRRQHRGGAFRRVDGASAPRQPSAYLSACAAASSPKDSSAGVRASSFCSWGCCRLPYWRCAQAAGVTGYPNT